MAMGRQKQGVLKKSSSLHKQRMVLVEIYFVQTKVKKKRDFYN